MIKVSAIVSLYNAMEFVEGCLEDLVQQTLFKSGELEIVVIDSNSPQGEKSVVERYQAQYPNIVYHRTAERETLYQAWNRGIELARGRYITNANSDDRHHPNALHILAKTLDMRPDIDLVYADVYESRIPNQTFKDNPGKVRYKYSSFWAPNSLLFHLFGCQPVWRKRVHDVMGGFDPTLRAAGDWDFCIRFCLAGLRALHVQQVLGAFLERDTSLSTGDATSKNEQNALRKKYINKATILNLYRREGFPIETPQEQARVFTEFAVQAVTIPLPWIPGKCYRDPGSALLSCTAAFELVGDDPRAAWNLGVALREVGYTDLSEQLLKQGLAQEHPQIARAMMGAADRDSRASLPYVPLE
jgi:glycosyltransferase involved in cell wall biosynthesis